MAFQKSLYLPSRRVPPMLLAYFGVLRSSISFAPVDIHHSYKCLFPVSGSLVNSALVVIHCAKLSDLLCPPINGSSFLRQPTSGHSNVILCDFTGHHIGQSLAIFFSGTPFLISGQGSITGLYLFFIQLFHFFGDVTTILWCNWKWI